MNRANTQQQEADQAAVYDVTARPGELIPPGTVIGREAPAPWTNLILKSHPRPTTGDLGRLDETGMRLASMLFTATLAKVEGERLPSGKVQYRLQRVAVGLGTRVNGKDTVLSPDTERQLGANVGLLGRIVLNKAYAELLTVRQVARSPFSAILDTPATMVREGKHASVIIRYVVLVDPPTGRLNTLAWAIDRDRRGFYTGAVPPVEWLAPNLLVDATLNIDGNEFTLGIPSERAFAIHRIPTGHTQFGMSEEFRKLAGESRLTPEMARLLEAKIRATMAQHAAKAPS